MKYIISYNQTSKNICLNELKSLNANLKELIALTSEQSLIQLNIPEQEFSKIVNKTPLIFIRHIIPIYKEITKPFNIEDIINIIIEKLNKHKSFSIQYLNNITKQEQVINVQEIANIIIQNGYDLNVKEPNQIVSFFETKSMLYLGISNDEINLSSYKAGMPHFSKKQEFISRAEYKLLEAIDLCKIDLNNLKRGADLGSAPGGWTKVLASHNIETHSIDPASLNPEIKAMQNIKYFRMTTEAYLKKYNYTNFDIVVNDMKMDIVLSTQIILDFYDRIANKGYVIMTFKLAKNFSYANIIKCIDKLKQKYTVILARQLFHNRSEITVVLQKSE